ncbi:MAG: type II secretion system F family protein [Oscillospiraceae bacterium]|nr:type II secretion system F family protein [Oscillospiraceae bacterium]
MPIFSYLAVDKEGKEKKGTIDSASRDEATEWLRQNGLVTVSLVDSLAISKEINLKFFERRPKPRDMAVFCRQFVSILSAGVNILSTLEMLGEQTENKCLSRVIWETRTEVEKGESLAGAMRANRNIFTDIFITMVEAGEASGSLEVSFTRMAEQFEKDAALRANMKKATIYPASLAVVAVAVIALLLVFVIPSFEEIFADLETDLPGLTIAVLAASNFMLSYGFIVFIALALSVILLVNAVKSKAGKRVIGRVVIKLPLFGNLTVKTSCARMARTLCTLIAAGIPMIEAIDITAATMTNVHFKDALLAAKEEVAMGNNLSEPIQRSALFPPLVHHMLKIGESTGGIETMLDKLADYYDEEVKNATQALMAAMEPMIIVLMAGIVGTLIVSVLMPMAEMYNALDNM